MTGLFNQETTKEFLAVVESMKSLYPEGSLPDQEAREAARRIIGFVKIMIDYDNLVDIKDQGEGKYLLTHTKESRFVKKTEES